MRKSFILTLLILIISCSSTQINSTKKTTTNKESKNVVTGITSWYSDKFQGKKTASGEKYDKNKLTAAHKTLPFGTKIKVTNVKNGKSVVVKINDRGPHSKNRLLDLSKAAFKKIGSINDGILNIKYEIIK